MTTFRYTLTTALDIWLFRCLLTLAMFFSRLLMLYTFVLSDLFAHPSFQKGKK